MSGEIFIAVCQSELVEDGLTKFSAGFDKLNLTASKSKVLQNLNHPHRTGLSYFL